jgi:protein TonB
MITTEGELKNIEIIKNITECPECDTEAIRLIQSMPKWEPATKDKSPIRTHMNLSITFKN